MNLDIKFYHAFMCMLLSIHTHTHTHTHTHIETYIGMDLKTGTQLLQHGCRLLRCGFSEEIHNKSVKYNADKSFIFFVSYKY